MGKQKMDNIENEIIVIVAASLLHDLLDLPEGSRITLKGLIADSLYADHQFSDDILETILELLKSLADIS